MPTPPVHMFEAWLAEHDLDVSTMTSAQEDELWEQFCDEAEADRRDWR